MNKKCIKIDRKYTHMGLTLALFLSLYACANQESYQQADLVESSVASSKVNKQSYLTRNIQDEVFYFVMPDRFHNAKPDNDNGDPTRPISYGGVDKTSKWAFHGGDIAGIEAKLDYIENLGVTAIWMTPILRNRAIQEDGFGHHGYWVVDFTEIDPHFGSNDDLKSLIEAAHKRDIKVFFDIITNHTADVIKYTECHDAYGKFLNVGQTGCDFISSEQLAQGKKYSPFILEAEKNVKVPAWLNDPKYYNNQGDSFWEGESAIKGDFVGLDDLDTSQPEVLSGLSEIFKNLITEFRPDGFRIDTVKHVDIEFWQSFSPAIMSHAQSIGLPEFFIFGEVYDGNPAGLSKFTTLGQLPSVLDFSFAFNTHDVVFNNKSVSQLKQLFENDDYYRDVNSNPNDLLNFIGNHDMGRSGHFIELALPDISDQEKQQRSELAHALMYMSRGVPVVYYGDEQGFTGDGGDVDARENMDPSLVDTYNDNNLIGTDRTTADSNFDVMHPLYQTFAGLAKVRHEHETLRRGEHIHRALDEDKRIYAFSRIMPEHLDDYLVVFNFSTKTQAFEMNVDGINYIKVAGNDKNTHGVSGDNINIVLAPLSYRVLKSDKPISSSLVDRITMKASYEENDRVFIPFDIEFAKPAQFNMATIEVYDVSVKGKKELLTFDTTPPYRAVLLPKDLFGVTKIKVVANSFTGPIKAQIFDFTSH